MKTLFVHPSCLGYSEIYLRLEPLGVQLAAAAPRAPGHEVRIVDLQTAPRRELFACLGTWRPQAVGFSLNYLANAPEVIDLAREVRALVPDAFVFAGGHSASFCAEALIEDSDGAIACVLRGDGEAVVPELLDRVAGGGEGVGGVPGAVTAAGAGPAPRLVDDLDRLRPARDLLRRRRRYFIGDLDPCASIEFTRGCPWDCSFCSAWTFYGRTYRKRDPAAIADELVSIREPHVFVVDDVAFIHAEDGDAIAAELERRRIRKLYYLETRGDVLLRNKEVFRRWRRLGLRYMFLGMEAIDEEGLRRHRKRISMGRNFEALEFARSLGIVVAVNIIADPSWDRERFAVLREWATGVPEIVHLTINTPYPGTETWLAEASRVSTLDYRLYDTQHAVLPTRLPLEEYYREFFETLEILNRKHLGFAVLKSAFLRTVTLLGRGQTNFFRMLWRFHAVHNAERTYREHFDPPRYIIRRPAPAHGGESLYVHAPEVREGRPRGEP